MHDMIKWKDISGYKGHYQVSNLGRVKSLRRFIYNKHNGGYFCSEKLLSINLDNGGYPLVILQRDRNRITTKVHRLVCIAFHENPENKPCVNHIDGDKENNRADNLEWCTYKENSNHAVSIGLISPLRGSESHASKLSDKDVGEIKAYLYFNFKYAFIMDKYNISQPHVSFIKNGKMWGHIEPNIDAIKDLDHVKNHKRVKVTEHDVKGIKTHINYGFRNKDISRMYSIPPMTISDIRNKKSWRNVKAWNY